jgi:hypothetical protein
MGMVVGLLANSTMWSVGQWNVTLDPGTLTSAQRANFGQTVNGWGWAWGGNIMGSNSIR